VNQDYLDFETEDCFDLILMIMYAFCTLSPAQRHKMLAKFHSLLLDGGAVILDVNSISLETYRSFLLNRPRRDLTQSRGNSVD